LDGDSDKGRLCIDGLADALELGEFQRVGEVRSQFQHVGEVRDYVSIPALGGGGCRESDYLHLQEQYEKTRGSIPRRWLDVLCKDFL
jgi:hypothetical protein